MSFPEILKRPLLFVNGKGGVGKTTLSRSLASAFSQPSNKTPLKTLWISIQNPLMEAGVYIEKSSTLTEYNCEPYLCFEEYVGMKLKITTLTKLFLDNKLMKFLATAAPGIPGLVMLGKIWHEMQSYEKIVVDMPSTGHGLSLFFATQNFAKLFKEGLVNQDAYAMLRTFSDPKLCGSLIVSLPEEMPLKESLEYEEKWLTLFPHNPSGFIVNKLFGTQENIKSENPHSWNTPFATSSEDYIEKRKIREHQNLTFWKEKIKHPETIPFFNISSEDFAQAENDLTQEISHYLCKTYLQ